MIRQCFIIFALFLLSVLATGEGFAVTAEEVRAQLGAGEKVTIVDIRSRALYAEEHIPGAINLPAAVIDKKRIPPLGEVVVYGDGIRSDIARKAVEALNAKKGIHAELLEGGFPAWCAVNKKTVRQIGMKKASINFITWEEFEKIIGGEDNVVLLDMRELNKATDLKSVFPGLDVMRLKRMPGSAKKRWDIKALLRAGIKNTQNDTLYILVDDGYGESEKAAYALNAKGIKRLAVLIGGEIIIKRAGRPDTKNLEK